MSKKKMDVNRLITEIYKRPALWDQNHVLHRNRKALHRIWQQLSIIMELPEATLKARWKNLRDSFRMEIKKIMAYSKNKSPSKRPRWKYYHRLLFLQDQMAPRVGMPKWSELECKNVLPNPNEDSSSDTDDSSLRITHYDNQGMEIPNEPEFVPIKEEHTSDDSENNNSLNPSNEMRNLANSDTGEPEDIARFLIQNGTLDEDGNSPGNNGPINQFGGNQHDDNYHFLMSLLPHMKKLTDERGMSLRMQLQELIYKEVYKK